MGRCWQRGGRSIGCCEERSGLPQAGHSQFTPIPRDMEEPISNTAGLSGKTY